MSIEAVAVDAPLVGPDEPPPFEVVRPDGSSPYMLICDHASARLPRALGTLGVSAADRQRHIAWDIGVAGVARCLSERLDAFLILSNYSRLAIDLNRPPGSPQSIVTLSERTEIPGNFGLSVDAAVQRRRALFDPYHGRIREELDRRARDGRSAVLISVHSFTPSYLDASRIWHMGVLYQRDARLAHLVLQRMRMAEELVVGDNEPYAVNDATDYSVVNHGEKRGIAHVELEIRQDLIDDAASQASWAKRFADLFEELLPAAIAL
jgi:predicted N-formylglutamate amidohydrolase